tara:strand:+ start:1075 stop:1860 length:786 start_codon:yes stop_codon:yes gene_type:complete
MIQKRDHIGVALSGGKDSSALLYLLNNVQKKTGLFQLTALFIDEGITKYRDRTLKFAQEICKQQDVKLLIVSFKNEFDATLDNFVKNSKLTPCTVCGVSRRYLLNKFALKNGFTKLATGHNLDDEAQSILMNLFKNNQSVQARLGPITGLKNHPLFVRRIKPFYFLLEKEVATYAYLHKLLDLHECPYHKQGMREEIRTMLNSFESKYPGTKHGLIGGFMELLPLMKKKYAIEGEIGACEQCGEPSSNRLCKCCVLMETIL